jgi:hypothetical protein
MAQGHAALFGLGAAAAVASPGAALQDLRQDFDSVNAILCAMSADVQNRLSRIWPLLTMAERLLREIAPGSAHPTR